VGWLELALLLSPRSESAVFVSVGGDASQGRYKNDLHSGSWSISGGEPVGCLGASWMGLVVKGEHHVEKSTLSLAAGVLERR